MNPKSTNSGSDSDFLYTDHS